MFDGLEEFDEDTQKRLLHQIGKKCAFAGSVEISRKIAAEEPNTTKRMARLQEYVTFPHVRPKTKNDWSTIQVEYPADREPCICPLVEYGVIDENPLLCECTMGWIQANFEILLGQPVSVSSQKTVCRGAKNCKFTVQVASK
ncbi:MAG: hypothetical protein ACFFD8_09820 [Candidatus Thorarchaeota archaeon]